jgi:hypothetical protein
VVAGPDLKERIKQTTAEWRETGDRLQCTLEKLEKKDSDA